MAKAASGLQPLNPATVPLYGRHLIEASAGTGKTFNITRIYLRLLLANNGLLGRPLRVQEILVMTFTKAATEELRGRIEQELRTAVEHWGKASDQQDPFLTALQARAETEHGHPKGLLESALVELDEAAVFTIHGFCHRVLSQESFASGLPMALAMEADTADLLNTAVFDWFRKINQNKADFQLLEVKGWHTPDAFAKGFREVLMAADEVCCYPNQQYVNDHPERFANIGTRKKDLLASLLTQEDFINTDFVQRLENQQAKRQLAWDGIRQWLAVADDAVCDDRVRLLSQGTGRKTKAISALFEPVRHLVDATDELLAVAINELVISGIHWIRQRFKALKVQYAVLDYGDLIVHLSQRLQADDGSVLINLLRQQYPVALVDEFQDTDPLQYAIFDSIYPNKASSGQGVAECSVADKNHALFMIGDPKQAIYGFRGGDIFAYLSARQQKDYGWQLTTNWRSTRAVVAACNRLFWGDSADKDAQDLFRYGIEYHQVSPSPHADQLSLNDPDPGRSAVNLLWMPAIENPGGKNGPVKDDWVHGLARWCVSEITRLLQEVTSGEAQGEAQGEECLEQKSRAVQEKDIAILVRSASEADVIRSYLQQAGLPSVYLSDRTPVFASEQAQELLLVLQGILEADNEAALIAALATRLMGGNAVKLAGFRQSGGEQLWEAELVWVAELSKKWLEQGCLALLLELIQHHYQPPPFQRERALTNMLQLAELLQKASKRHGKPQELLQWLRDQCQQPGSTEEAEQRLESDANLIRVITQHGAKGLEYPIVFVPFASAYRDPAKVGNKKLSCYKYHDPDNNTLRYQVGHSDLAEQLVQQEGHAESVRLLYVAITRAIQRCYIGAAPFGLQAANVHQSALGQLLGIAECADLAGWQEQLSYLQETAGATINIITISSATELPARQVAAEFSATHAQALTFRGFIDDSWRLASFSALARRVQTARIDGNDHGDDSPSDLNIPLSDYALSQETEDLPGALPLRFTLQKGIKAGDLLHGILEHTDFAAPDWSTAMEGPLRLFDNQAGPEIQPALASWLDECLQTPIPMPGDSKATCKLAELTTDKTLREAEFYFPLEKLSKQELAGILTRHRDDSHSGGRHSGGRHRADGSKLSLLGDEQGKLLSGMMHGYIDLIFEHHGQFFVCDYKSTHLGNTFADYSQSALENDMQSHFYDLQYLIYGLALHRYLQVRLGDRYNPDHHFGGVYYFYLRGMSPFSEVPCSGIFQRNISGVELAELERLFNGKLREPWV